MRIDFRIGLFVGLGATIMIVFYCVWLWQQERQIVRHTENLFRRIDQKNWSGFADLVAVDYADQWGNDRALLLERMRLVLGYSRQVHLHVSDSNCKIDNGVGIWRGRITIEGDDSDLVAAAKVQVNSLTTPFELRWRKVSDKPWDWKLVRVSNPDLDIIAGFD
jgi:hypothetical protein